MCSGRDEMAGGDGTLVSGGRVSSVDIYAFAETTPWTGYPSSGRM